MILYHIMNSILIIMAVVFWGLVVLKIVRFAFAI